MFKSKYKRITSLHLKKLSNVTHLLHKRICLSWKFLSYVKT